MEHKDNDHARLAPASALAPENLTNAPITETVRDAGSWTDAEVRNMMIQAFLSGTGCDCPEDQQEQCAIDLFEAYLYQREANQRGEDRGSS